MRWGKQSIFWVLASAKSLEVGSAFVRRKRMDAAKLSIALFGREMFVTTFKCV